MPAKMPAGWGSGKARPAILSRPAAADKGLHLMAALDGEAGIL
jgi:hypothetical protein